MHQEVKTDVPLRIESSNLKKRDASRDCFNPQQYVVVSKD